MAKIIKETVITKDVTPTTSTIVSEEVTPIQTIERVIYFFFGVIEILLGFRFVLKLTGANAATGFVSFIYSLTGIFTMPFDGIFRRMFAQGLETTSVFEPSTLVALVVYMVLAWGLVQLLHVLTGEEPTV